MVSIRARLRPILGKQMAGRMILMHDPPITILARIKLIQLAGAKLIVHTEETQIQWWQRGYRPHHGNRFECLLRDIEDVVYARNHAVYIARLGDYRQVLIAPPA